MYATYSAKLDLGYNIKIVVGSCMRKQDDRDVVIAMLATSSLAMFSVKRCLDQLVFVWSDQVNDKRCYGLQGLSMAMEKWKFSICMG